MYNYENYWCEKDDISKLTNIAPEKIIVFDTETTGLNPYGNDEILQLAIINGNNEEVFNSLFKPEMRKTWTKAAEINGITPRMVKDSPHFADVKDDIQKIFDNAELIIAYNVEFDMRFLNASGIKVDKNKLIFDVMKEYAVARGVRDSYYGDYKWTKLEQCASAYKYKFEAHDALEDTKATLHCFKSLLNDERYLNLINENKEATERYRQQKAREEELIRAEEEKRKQKEARKQEIYTKTAKPMNVVRIILLVIGVLWLVVITLAGLTTESVGIGYTLLFDVPGIILILIAIKIKKSWDKNKN